MMINEALHSDLAVPPGEYLEEVIEALGMSKNELAKRMDRPAAKLSAIFSGDKAITPETALQLERVVSVPAHVWMGLESEYRLVLARQTEQEEEERLNSETHLVKDYCYAALANRGYVDKKTKPIDKVRELLSFFGVTSLENIPSIKRYQVAFRSSQSQKHKRSPEALIAWLRIGEVVGTKTRCAPFNKTALREIIPVIRKLTTLSPEESIPMLETMLSDVGVVLVLCQHLSRTYAHGATFWLGSNKAVLMLSLRGSWADIFWFSLLHELGHILLHSKRSVFIDGKEGMEDDETAEKEADQFASNALLPIDLFQAFALEGEFYANDIEGFAARIDVHPGIVVGRLKHHNLIQQSWHNGLRVQYEFTNC